MAQNPFSPQSNMTFFGGANDMATMLPGSRSTFGSSAPATAAPATAATAAPAVNGNATAIANAAAALGTGPTSAATGASANPFAPASNLNFSGATDTTPFTAAAGPGQIAPHDPSAVNTSSGLVGPYSPGGSMYNIAPPAEDGRIASLKQMYPGQTALIDGMAKMGVNVDTILGQLGLPAATGPVGGGQANIPSGTPGSITLPGGATVMGGN